MSEKESEKPSKKPRQFKTRVEVTPAERGLTRKQVAVMTGYAEKSLRNLATLRKGPPFRKYRGHCIYFESDVLAWIRSMPLQGGGAAA